MLRVERGCDVPVVLARCYPALAIGSDVEKVQPVPHKDCSSGLGKFGYPSPPALAHVIGGKPVHQHRISSSIFKGPYLPDSAIQRSPRSGRVALVEHQSGRTIASKNNNEATERAKTRKPFGNTLC